MPAFIIAVVLLGSIVALATALAAARHQFEAGGGSEAGPGVRPIAPVRASTNDGSMSQVVASAIERTHQTHPRNSAEAAATAALRSACDLAVEGAFQFEVGEQLDGIDGLSAFHDLRKPTVGAATIDHIVVAPSGVYVIACEVRSARVTLTDDAVYIGRGADRRRDAMVDDVLRQVASVVGVVSPSAVHGVIVMRDLLALPNEIRTGSATVKGVTLITPAGLEALLARPGPVEGLPLAAARIREAFQPGLAGGDGELRLARSQLGVGRGAD